MRFVALADQIIQEFTKHMTLVYWGGDWRAVMHCLPKLAFTQMFSNHKGNGFNCFRFLHCLFTPADVDSSDPAVHRRVWCDDPERAHKTRQSIVTSLLLGVSGVSLSTTTKEKTGGVFLFFWHLFTVLESNQSTKSLEHTLLFYTRPIGLPINFGHKNQAPCENKCFRITLLFKRQVQ